MACPGSLALTAGRPDTASRYAAEGTAAHEIGALCLAKNIDADAFIGTTIEADGYEFLVDLDMAGHIQTYIDNVRTIVGQDPANPCDLLVEQTVDFSSAIGQPNSTGTSDAVIISQCGRYLTVVDLKYGQGVKVYAEDNEQLMLYALGALDSFAMLGEFEQVLMVIDQPRLGHHDFVTMDVVDLRAFAAIAKAGAERAADAIALHAAGLTPEELLVNGYLVTGEKQCRFCDAKAVCPALAASVAGAILNDDAKGDIDTLVDFAEDAIAEATATVHTNEPLSLGRKMAMVDLVEIWCKAVRAAVESDLINGVPVEGWKLVEGKRGARQWVDKREAEAVLKSMRLPVDVMYDLSLISPTSADKLAKAGTIGPRQWPKLKAMITQSPGKPHVAPAGDPRGELASSASLVDIPDADADLDNQAHPFR
jgi:hypothetical protein